MVLAVLEYTKNDDLLGSQENLIINTCKRDNGLMITVLQDGTAFTAAVSPESSCVKLWATRLQLTAPEYLEQLELALHLSAQHSANSKQNCKQDAAVAEIGSGSTKNTHKTTPNSEGPEHVFEISSGTLLWKQYFVDKKVHGKRGAIPLEQESISSAAWCVLREAAHKQRDTLQQLQQLEHHSRTLIKERESAAAVAQQGVVLLEQFRQQTYAKFCHLLNSKKLKIRELTQQLKDSNTASVSAPVSGIVAGPSTSAREPAPKRSNVRVVGGRRKVSVPVAGAISNPHDDGDFDDDTDVDDNLHSEDECNTDEEKELIAEKRVNAPKSKLYSGSGEPLNSAPVTGVNTKLPTSSYDTKEDDQCATSSSTSKRKQMDNSAFNLNTKKRSNVFDSQDDSFDMSQEGARESLLSNIRPRNKGCEVSKNSASHSTHLSSPLVLNSSTNCVVSKSLAARGSDAAAASTKDCKRDQETVSFVANLLRRNVKERQAKGYGMPIRLDDFNLGSKHLDIDFLSKSPLLCVSRTHPRTDCSAVNIVPSPTAAGIREFDEESDQEHHRDFFGESSREEVPHSTNIPRSQVNCSFPNKSEQAPYSSFAPSNRLGLSEFSNPKADVDIVDKINSISDVRLDKGSGNLSITSSLFASITSKANKRNVTSVFHDNIVSIQKRGPEMSVDGSQVNDYDALTEILDVDNCSLGNSVSKHIKSVSPSEKVLEQCHSKTDIKPGGGANKDVLEQDDSKEDKKTGSGIASNIAAVLSGITGNALDGSSSSSHINTDAPDHSAMKSSDTRDLDNKIPATKRSVESSSATTADTRTPETKRIKPNSDDLSFHQFRVGSIIEDVFM